MTPAENEALAMAEFATGVAKVHSTPRFLTLETTSRCNLRCVMCPHAIGAVTRPKHLDDELVGKIARYLRRVTGVQLHGIGEPTNSPAFWGLLGDLAPPESCGSSINSNFTNIDDARIRKLLDSNLALINISLDAGAAATYRKIRGFSFETVLGNIERFLDARRARGQRFPLVYLNMTLMRSNIEELKAFIGIGARLGVDQVQFWHMNRWSEAEMARYVVEREGWTFDYSKEGLWNHAALSNRCISEAVAFAREVGVPLRLDINKEVYFDDPEAGS